MKDLKRMRLICGLRQIDLAIATGIALYKISSAETGRSQLSESDAGVLRDFLATRWHSIQELEAGSVFDGSRRVTTLARAMSA